MASVFPLVKLTSGPDTTATVLHDFNVDDTLGGAVRSSRVQSEGFTIGAPELLGDPDSVFPQYGNRTIGFTVKVKGPKTYALGKIAAANRWLLRDDCWLLVQLNALMKPVWFKLYRPQPRELSFDNVYLADGNDNWGWPVSLPAEPYAYGARQTIGPVTINNDPAAGSNPCTYTLPAILGDAPAPLRIVVNPSAAAYMNGYKWMHALHAGTSAVTPVVWQVGTGDGWTAGTDTGAAIASAAYSGGSYRPVSFATDATLVTRISGTAPATLPAGKRKVLVRFARSDTTSTFNLRFGLAVGLGTKYGDTVAMNRGASTTAGHATWVDLGQFTFPWGLNAPPGATGLPATPQIALQMARTSGTGSANIDAIMLVPVDISGNTIENRILFSDFNEYGIGDSSGEGWWDGDSRTYWGYTPFGNFDVAVPQLVGGFPLGIPGMSNVLTMLQQVNGTKSLFANDASDDISLTAAVTISYLPRWLYIGDGT